MREHFNGWGCRLPCRCITGRPETKSRWRLLNPMETLKAIYKAIKAVYESLGAPHPRLSLIAVFIICGAVGSGIWWLVGTQVAKDSLAKTPPLPNSAINQSASDSTCSNVSGGKDVTINCPSSSGAKDAPKQPPTQKP